MISASSSGGLGRGGPFGAHLLQIDGGFAVDVVDSHLMAGLEDVSGHGVADVAGAYECNSHWIFSIEELGGI